MAEGTIAARQRGMRVGVVAVGRSTFDLEVAAITAAAMRGVLANIDGLELTDPVALALDGDESQAAGEAIADVDAVVLLQATFTDSTLPAAALASTPLHRPVVLWGAPEPRTGGRLTMNALCGINLAAYRLRADGRDVRALYLDPAAPDAVERIAQALRAPLPAPPARAAHVPDVADHARAEAVRERMAGMRIGRVGHHPDGFDPCAAGEDDLATLGATLDHVELEELFEGARAAVESDLVPLRTLVASRGAGEFEQEGVDATLRLHLALLGLVDARSWSAVATRCWPECFTEIGGAACAAQGMLADRGVPATCEADVLGAATAVALEAAASSPAFVADLVDAAEDGTVAFWHCGLAAPSLAHPDEPIGTTLHPNRRKPLLHEFRLRPGRITIARFGHADGGLRLALGGGEIVDEPRPFTGTAAVVRPDTPAEDLVATVLAEGLDHHYGLVHGDVRGVMAAVAEQLGIPIVVL
jgi:L-fucose isomerase-like protein